MAKVSNNVERLISFASKHKVYTVIPETPLDVPNEHLDEAWEKGSIVFVTMVKDGCLTFDGWSPPGDVKVKMAIPKEHRGIGKPTGAPPQNKEEVDPKTDGEKLGEPRLSGTVPGNPTLAREVVAKCSDPAQIKTWLEVEKRSTVRKALVDRLAELESASSSNDEGED